jgi:hypothetical protein
MFVTCWFFIKTALEVNSGLTVLDRNLKQHKWWYKFFSKISDIAAILYLGPLWQTTRAVTNSTMLPPVMSMLKNASLPPPPVFKFTFLQIVLVANYCAHPQNPGVTLKFNSKLSNPSARQCQPCLTQNRAFCLLAFILLHVFVKVRITRSFFKVRFNNNKTGYYQYQAPG